MDHLEDRLGPLLFQFPCFKRGGDMTEAVFLSRLKAFLPTLPTAYRFSVEVRNRWWLKPALLNLLREHGVALTLIDQR